MFKFLVFLCALETIPVAFSLGCQRGWLPFEGKCYLIGRDTKSWYAAKGICDDNLSHLAIIETPKVNKWLVLQILSTVNSQTWIGGTDLGNEGKWKWESTGNEIGFSDWKPPQPNNVGGVQHCLQIENSKWNDDFCNRSHHYICQKNQI